jgi:hypothetical protein
MSLRTKFATKALAPKVPKEPRPKKPRAPKVEKPVNLSIPAKVEGIDRWIVFGLDPSLSRTGFAVMDVTQGEDRSVAKWIDVGSMKPDEAGDAVWIRSKAIALALRDKFKLVLDEHFNQHQLARTGLIISFEAPTPNNDFLTSISRILHLILLEPGSPADLFAQVHVQMTNAATLRRLMGLVQKGASNKTENVARAYTFLDQGTYPNLDTDACDAVLMGMMARYSAAILMGFPHTIPERFLIALTNGETEVVGKGRNAKTRTKGIMHRREYWTLYTRKDYAVLLRDARTSQTASAARDKISSKNLALILQVQDMSWVLPTMSSRALNPQVTARSAGSAPLSNLVHFIRVAILSSWSACLRQQEASCTLTLLSRVKDKARELTDLLGQSTVEKERRVRQQSRAPPEMALTVLYATGYRMPILPQ